MRCDYVIIIFFFKFLVLKAQCFFPKDLAKNSSFHQEHFYFFPKNLSLQCESLPKKNKVANMIKFDVQNCVNEVNNMNAIGHVGANDV
jgi:hypothetical protein